MQTDLGTALESVNSALAKMTQEEGWALGEGYRVRGDIHAMIGDLEAARADYAQAYAVGWDAEPGNAMLLGEAGEVDAALGALDRTLTGNTWFHLQRRLWIKAHKAWIAARHGRSETAQEALNEIGTELASAGKALPSIHALMAESQAHLVEPQDPDRTRLLLLARQLWTSAGYEYQEARLRIEIAEHLAAGQDHHGAQRELDAAQHLSRSIGSEPLIKLIVARRAAPLGPARPPAKAEYDRVAHRG